MTTAMHQLLIQNLHADHARRLDLLTSPAGHASAALLGEIKSALQDKGFHCFWQPLYSFGHGHDSMSLFLHTYIHPDHAHEGRMEIVSTVKSARATAKEKPRGEFLCERGEGQITICAHVDGSHSRAWQPNAAHPMAA